MGDPGSVPNLPCMTASSPPRVLVVDDEENYARVTALGLKLEGFRVETALGADAALVSLGEERFDIAILDLIMPETNGIELARIVQRRHPETLVVLTSAYHLTERQLVRADCGAVGFVPKPFDLAELARFLRAKLAASELPS
jgi:DNA-binding response OmpR family regulator